MKRLLPIFLLLFFVTAARAQIYTGFIIKSGVYGYVQLIDGEVVVFTGPQMDSLLQVDRGSGWVIMHPYITYQNIVQPISTGVSPLVLQTSPASDALAFAVVRYDNFPFFNVDSGGVVNTYLGTNLNSDINPLQVGSGLDPGFAGQVLTSQGPGLTPIWSTSGATGLVNWVDSGNVNWPNITRKASIFFAKGATFSDINAVIQPVGIGSVLGNTPDGTALGGNQRGPYAVDWQLLRADSLNVASGDYSVISGGYNNLAFGPYAVAAGGANNFSYGTGAGISGGSNNLDSGDYSAITGGSGNIITSQYATVGGQSNADSSNNTVIFGSQNIIADSGATYSAIGGGNANLIQAQASVIAGGANNAIHLSTSGGSIIGGGDNNSVTGTHSTLSGGYHNTISNDRSAIAGGQGLTLSGSGSFGFLGGNSGSNNMSVSANNVSLLGNTDLYIANNDNTARSVYFFAPNPTTGAFPGAAKYVGFKAGVVGVSVIWTLPTADGSAGQVLQTDGSGALSWLTASGSGTVTSVALTAPSEITVTGSPITISGTFALTWANQTTNKVFAAPNGSTGTPSFRLLAAADIPALPYVTSVALSMPSIFSVSGSPVTSSGTLTAALNTQSANLVFAGPVSGGAATPTFRALVAADIPTGFRDTLHIGDTVASSVAHGPLIADGTHHLAQSSLVGTTNYLYTSNGTAFDPTFQKGSLTYLVHSPTISSQNNVQPISSGVASLSLKTSSTSDTNAFEVWKYDNSPYFIIDSLGVINIFNTLNLNTTTAPIGLYDGVSLEYGNAGDVMTSQGAGVTPIWYPATSLITGSPYRLFDADVSGNLSQVPLPADTNMVLQGGTGSRAYWTEHLSLGTGGGTHEGAIQIYGLLSGYVSLRVPSTIGTPYNLVVPANAGTAGYILQTDGTGITSWVSGGSIGGLVNIVETLNSSAPNATVKVEELKVSGGATSTDNDLSLVPKGDGSFLLSTPDNTSTGGNKRVFRSVDLQMKRALASQIASGSYSVISGGQSNKASANWAVVVGGDENIASGVASVAGGASCTASGLGSVAFGQAATADKLGQFSLSSGTQTGVLGSSQVSIMSPQIRTTDATANVELKLNRSDHVTLSNNTAWTFQVLVVGKQNSSTNYTSYVLQGSVVRGANAASTVVNGVTTTTIVDNIGVAGVPSVITDATNGGIQIVVTGKAATTIDWVANLQTAEVTL